MRNLFAAIVLTLTLAACSSSQLKGGENTASGEMEASMSKDECKTIVIE